MTQLRKRGIATAVICSRPFAMLATGQARIHGCPDLPLLVIDHPLGGVNTAGVRARAEDASAQLVRLLRKEWPVEP
jgi:hypothetical protein